MILPVLLNIFRHSRAKSGITFFSIVLFLTQPSFGQDLDTWFMAGRAVNAPAKPPIFQFWQLTPLPPPDGTSLTYWSDFSDGQSQDGIPHPLPADYSLPPPIGLGHSFGSPSHLTPIGSIPGTPILARNSMDNINHNPVVLFDGSGNGQALHYRSVTREDITLYVVFKAIGAGNSAETMRLLHGGDIDTHHSSTTNLSLGVSAGNMLSVGRTWAGDGGGYFQSGSINTLGEPTIGVLSREVTGTDQETLQTWVNGQPDIDVIWNHLLAPSDLYLFNRLGKHFNSSDPNRNLSGSIAEILLLDGKLDTNSRQRVESYLAIKYGITLNNDLTGQLGSTVGNEVYNYLTADGTIFWQAEANYKYDIAGIGTDRYQDIPGTKLRYNQDQRISKSVNPGALVTISTNTDFINDALDFSRTSIDGDGPSYDHNYLVWANDGRSIDETAMELPPLITTRMEREWKVQKTYSPAVNEIMGVSLRMELGSSNILANGNCGIKLLIDSDGDGDFTTGPITQINATSVDGGGNAFFDNVDFKHNNVFTVGYSDTENPNASNPAPISVCDLIPLPDPLVVTDETDNCGVPTVTHQGDMTDGNTNPETISRTYRVTDSANNFIDVVQTIIVYSTPSLDPLGNIDACDSFVLPPIGGIDLTGSEAFYDAPNGGGNQYNPGDNITVSGTFYIYDETGSTPNCFDEEVFIITVNNSPLADAPADVESCDSHALPPLVNGTYHDAPNGGGNILNAGDVVNSSMTLYVFSPGTGSCPDAENSFDITINYTPNINPISNEEDCSSFVLPLIMGTNLTGNQAYYDAPNGGGNQYNAGDVITSSNTFYIYDETGSTPNCSDEESFTVTIQDIEDPTASNPTTINVQCSGDVPMPDILVVTDEADNCGVPNVAFVSDVSDGLSNPETITRTYSITDGAGNSIDVDQTITVNDTTDPIITAPADVNIDADANCEANPALGIPVTNDNCSVASATNDAPSPFPIGITLVTWSVTDGAGNTAQDTQTVTVNDNEDPTASNPAPINVECVTDVPAPDILVVIDEADNCSVPTVAFVSDVSDGLSNPETITRSYSVTDGAGNSIDVEQTITVNDTTDPTASNPAPINVQCSGDVPTHDTLMVTDEADNCGIPTVAFISDVSDGLSNPETITRTYSVTDGAGNSIDVQQIITVDDTINPTASNPASINVQCSGDVPTPDTMVVTDEGDNCGVPTVAFVSDVSDGLSNPETITRTYSVTDGAGNSIDVEQTITVNDTTDPTASNPAPINVQCSGDVPTHDTLMVADEADNCGVPTVAFVSDVSDGQSNPETITRTYSVTDGAGNSIDAQQTITVDDTTDPTITAPADVIVDADANCKANPILGIPVTNDNCSVASVANDAPSPFPVGVTVVTWTVTDNAGNTAQDNQTVTVVDNEIPTASNPAPIVVCNAPPPPDTLVVIDEADNCGVLAVTHQGDVSDGNTNPELITRTYRITDGANNFIDVTQTISVYTTPNIDPLGNIDACESFVLPPITGTSLTGNERYYDAPNGGGNQLNPGDIITSTGTFYIYDETGSIPNCFAEEMFGITINTMPLADAPEDVVACESYELPSLANGNYFDAPNGGGNALFEGDTVNDTAILYVFSPENGSCGAVDNSFNVVINKTDAVHADAPEDVESCGPYILPTLMNGNYYTGPGGTGTQLSAGDIVDSSMLLYVFNPGSPPCPDAENNFSISIISFSLNIQSQNESCTGATDGKVHISGINGTAPYMVSVNNYPPIPYANDSFSFEQLESGNYEIKVTDSKGCEVFETIQIQSDNPNLNAIIESTYNCDPKNNTIMINLEDPSEKDHVMYALDSSHLDDYRLDSSFSDVGPGDHYISILHNSGCLEFIPFEVDTIAPFQMELSHNGFRKIEVSVSGGFPPYTYFLDQDPGTTTPTLTVPSNGTFSVRVLDSKGCELVDSITVIDFIDIIIPNYFTPNQDGANDFWGPRNIRDFPNIRTLIVDRHGREIKTMGQTDNGWDGTYKSRPLPAGDYWYKVSLNDKTGREYIGHFTLYR
ncbi:MAG: T9SS type B sorting domain-containing protein [Bacteroidota bacterium]